MAVMETIERLSTYTAEQHRNALANDFVRLVMCLGIDGQDGTGRLSNDLDRIHAAEAFAARWPNSVNLDLVRKAAVFLHHKAGVDPGPTTDPGWAAPLAPIRPFAGAFVALSQRDR